MNPPIHPPCKRVSSSRPDAAPRRFATWATGGAERPVVRVYQVPRPAIQFLTATVEASDGIGLVRTLDESRGIVEFWMMPDFVDDFDALFSAVTRSWPIQYLGRELD